MYIAPVGLLCAGDPLGAELMAADVTAVNQHGRPRDAAGAYAAALAACFIPGMTVEGVVEAALRHLGDEKTLLEVRAMLDLAGRCQSDAEFIERYYTEIIGPVLPYQDWQHLGKPLCNSWNSSEVLGPALAFFLRNGGADARAITMSCARLGRDADTIARVGAGLAGAWAGLSAFPEEWVSLVLANNPWMRAEEKSAKLAEIVRRRLRRDAERFAAIAATAGAAP
jgi:ADP-ribosylglycohydrolase